MLVKHYAYGLKSGSFSIHVENNVRRKLVVFLFLDLTFKRQPHKMVKHTQTVRRNKRTNCLSVFDHFAELARKELMKFSIFENKNSDNITLKIFSFFSFELNQWCCVLQNRWISCQCPQVCNRELSMVFKFFVFCLLVTWKYFSSIK